MRVRDRLSEVDVVLASDVFDIQGILDGLARADQ